MPTHNDAKKATQSYITKELDFKNPSGISDPQSKLILDIFFLLDKLANKAISLKDRGEMNAFNAASRLHQKISKISNAFWGASEKNKTIFGILKADFDNAIAEAKPELEKHRSWWNDFTANLAMHVVLLACTLGIGNAIALSYNYYQSGGQSVFFKMPTDSAKLVADIANTAEKLGNVLP